MGIIREDTRAKKNMTRLQTHPAFKKKKYGVPIRLHLCGSLSFGIEDQNQARQVLYSKANPILYKMVLLLSLLRACVCVYVYVCAAVRM